MDRTKKYVMYGCITILFILAVNIAAYNLLGDTIYIKFGIDGQLQNPVSKTDYFMRTPVLLLAIPLYMTITKNVPKMLAFIGVALFVMNLATVFFNLAK